MKKGISLISLIITIAVIVIIAGATIQKGIQRTDDAKLAKHNTNISTTQEEIESYYYYKDGNLPVVNLTPYPIASNPTLLAEITKNGEDTDEFYIVDLSKLGKVGGKDGTGIGDDIYIVSSKKHTVYYVKGSIVKGLVYHGLGVKNSGSIVQAGGTSPTGSATTTPTNGATATPTLEPTSTPTNSPTPTPIPNGGFDGTVNSPKTAAGMTPIRWSGSTPVDLDATEKQNLNNEWYDYRNTGGTANKWANVRLKDGSTLVWIPRYTYKILNNEHTSTAGNIDIKFSNGTTDDTSGGYRVHPAFYWGGWNIPISAPMTKQAGGTELTGIWVGKFETSAANGLSDVSGDKVKIVPNIQSWRFMRVSDYFSFCSQMQTHYSNTYGISTSTSLIDTHLLKNSEWGAVAYLSKYALGSTKVAKNPNSSYITANGDMVVYKAQSTTGNEYGIYDMSGCAEDYVAAYVDDDSLNTLTWFGSGLVSAAAKYKDVFPKTSPTDSTSIDNYAATNLAYGMAIYETSSSGESGSYSWFGQYASFPDGVSALLTRGGAYDDSDAGIFNYTANMTYGNSFGFRVGCVVP